MDIGKISINFSIDKQEKLEKIIAGLPIEVEGDDLNIDVWAYDEVILLKPTKGRISRIRIQETDNFKINPRKQGSSEDLTFEYNGMSFRINYLL